MIRRILKLNNQVIPYIMAIIFLYSGMEKVIHFEVFMVRFSKISLVYYLGLWPLGYFLVFLEITIAIFLIFSIYRRKTLLFTLLLFVIFTAYLINVINGLGNYTTCACGGIFNFLTISQHIIFNIILIILIFFSLNKNGIESY